MCSFPNIFIVVLMIFIPLHLVHSIPPNIPSNVKTEAEEREQPKVNKPPVQPVIIPIVDSPKEKLKQPLNSTVEKSTAVHSTLQPELPKINETFEEKGTELGPGAVNRAIIVFVLISLAFFVFVGVKTCRRKHTDKSRVMVRKYGVRTNRSDIEMEPLPLSDEEDYDTLFDITASRSNLK